MLWTQWVNHINHSVWTKIKRLLISRQMFTLVSVCRRESLVIPDNTKRLTHKGLVFWCLALSTNSCFMRQRLVYKLLCGEHNRVRQRIRWVNNVLYHETVLRTNHHKGVVYEGRLLLQQTRGFKWDNYTKPHCYFWKISKAPAKHTIFLRT